MAQVSPRFHWDWPYLRFIQSKLDQVTKGEIKRLAICVPPRHGKTEMTTVRYPVWRLKQDPETRVIIGAYNQTTAEEFSHKARSIARDDGLELSKDVQAVTNWKTVKGGGIRASGVGTGVTGKGADLIIIDDPVKSREEAESATMREKVWNWYKDDLYTRLEPNGAIIVIMTRWHTDDLLGRLLSEAEGVGDRWEVVNLPALAEKNDPLGRAEGAALCPERYPEDVLHQREAVLGPQSFASLFQQRPQPKGGSVFKTAEIKYVEAAPAEVKVRLRWWDLAATKAEDFSGIDSGPDFTAGVLLSITAAGIITIEDIAVFREDAAERDKRIKQVATLDGRAVTQWFEQEPGSAGKSQGFYFVTQLPGLTVKYQPTSGDKEVEAGPLSSQMGVGNVQIVRTDTNLKAVALAIHQFQQFPNGAHDDIPDGASKAYNKAVALMSRGGTAKAQTETREPNLGRVAW